MMIVMAALPLILVGGAALLLLSGKKKKTVARVTKPQTEEEVPEGVADEDEEPEEGELKPGDRVDYGTRNDMRGPQYWKIIYEGEELFRALLLNKPAVRLDSQVIDDFGIAESEYAAKELIRDVSNAKLLDMYGEGKFIEDPVPVDSAAELAKEMARRKLIAHTNCRSRAKTEAERKRCDRLYRMSLLNL